MTSSKDTYLIFLLIVERLTIMTLKLKDILMMAITAVVFGVVYLAAVYAAVPVTTALTPFGLASLGYEPFFGIWYMAAAFAIYVIRKPGVGLIAEVIAAVLETLMGNFFGPMVIVTGLVEGLGFELPFALTRYKKFTPTMLAISSITASSITLVYNWFVSGYFQISIPILALMLAARIVSALFFSTFVVHTLTKTLAKAGILNSYASNDLKD